MIEEAIVNIYLAHLTQMCQSTVFTADYKFIAYNNRRVLCPKPFLDYINNPNSYTIHLAEIIKTADIVCLEPGVWQNLGKVLKWQASLAVCRKHKTQLEPILMHSNPNLPPAYSEKVQPPVYSEE